MNDVILLTEQERQEVRSFTETAYVLSDVPPNLLLTVEDDALLLGLDVPYPRNDPYGGDTSYFVEMAYPPTDTDMVFAVLHEIGRVAGERWAELVAEK